MTASWFSVVNNIECNFNSNTFLESQYLDSNFKHILQWKWAYTKYRCLGNYRGAQLGEAKSRDQKGQKENHKCTNVMNCGSWVGPSTSFKIQSPTFHSLQLLCPCLLTTYCHYYNSSFFICPPGISLLSLNGEETLHHLLKGLCPPPYRISHLHQTNQRVYQNNSLFQLPRSILLLPVAMLLLCYHAPFFMRCFCAVPQLTERLEEAIVNQTTHLLFK